MQRKKLRLNAAQRQAVAHDLGPALVLAGAGSGKTGVVTRRIAALIERGVPASTILAMTFTNKAAAEMLQRVKLLAGSTGGDLNVSTFHHFGLHVLSREVKALGLRGRSFAILDQGDCAAVVRDALRRICTGKSYDVHAILARISLAKNAFLEPAGYAAAVAGSEDPYDEITALIYPEYTAALAGLQAFDFDDLICEPVRLWRRRPDVQQRWSRRFRYLIVDEYQDTNPAQLELLRLLTTEHQNLCVVGDDDQAIYAWRGADIRNILEFERHFAGTRVIKLERNYRSTKAILTVANAVLAGAGAARRHPKKLIATCSDGEKVRKVIAQSPSVEAGFVAAEIKGIIDRGDYAPRDIAVLYRSNSQAAEVEAALKERQIGYRLVGGTQYFERKEVKDVIAYLTVAANPTDELAVRRAVNYPPRGIGSVALGKLSSFATARGLPLLGAVEQAQAIAGLSPAARDGCRQFAQIIAGLRQALGAGTPSALIARDLLATLRLKQVLFDESKPNLKAAARRWGNVRFLLRALERRDAKQPTTVKSLAEFLRLLALREDDQPEDDGADNRITLTTIHGAKGLEYHCVFIIGLEEGLLPHARTMEERATDPRPLDGVSGDDIDQERRLFYVAVTRARRRLYLCRAEARAARGKLVKRAPSRFLLDIPEELLEEQEVGAAQPSAAETLRGVQDVLAALKLAAGPG